MKFFRYLWEKRSKVCWYVKLYYVHSRVSFMWKWEGKVKVCVLIWIYIFEGYKKLIMLVYWWEVKLNELYSGSRRILKIKRLKFNLYYKSRRYLCHKSFIHQKKKKNEHLWTGYQTRMLSLVCVVRMYVCVCV